MHAAGAKQATEHLLALGHRRIGAIAGAPGLVRDRGAAARLPRRARGAGHPARPRARRLLGLADAARHRGGRAAARRFPIRRRRSSASTTTSRSARCTPRASAGSRCRTTSRWSASTTREQAVIVTPQLTSVRQPLAELGRMGVSLLVRILEGQRVDALRMELSTKLVVRESTAPPRERRSCALAIVAALVARRHCDRRSARARQAGRATRTRSSGSSRIGGGTRRTPTAQLVNAWGLAASPTGPWWTANEASDDEHAVLRRRAQAAADGARRRRPDRRRFIRRQGLPRLGGRRLRSGALHLRVRGREAARVDADRAGAAGRRSPRSSSTRRGEAAVFRGVAIARRAGLRDRLPQRARRRLRRALAARAAAAARSSTAAIPVVVRAVRHPGDRRPRLRDVCLARAGERQRRADRRLRRRVRPRREARRARRGTAGAERAVGPRARAALVRPLRRRPARRQLRRRPHQRVPATHGGWVYDGAAPHDATASRSW